MNEFEVFTIAGTGEEGDKNGSGNEATFNFPWNIAVRNDGTIIVSDSLNHKIKGIDLDGNVYTIAGTGEKGDKDGPANESTFNYPCGIAVKDDGTIIVVDRFNHKIRGIDLYGNVFTIAGTGEEGDKDGPVNGATFNCPCGVATRNDGTIIVADTDNCKIRGINYDGNVFTIAGTGRKGDKDGQGNEAMFNCPSGVAIDNDGAIIVVDSRNHKIKGIDLDGNVYTIAGTGEFGDKDGSGNEATFCFPSGIAIDNGGAIIVSDSSNNKIRGIDSDGNVYTIVGTGEEGDKNGHGNEATFNDPDGISISNDGTTIIVVDSYNNKIRGIRAKKLTKSAIK